MHSFYKIRKFMINLLLKKYAILIIYTKFYNFFNQLKISTQIKIIYNYLLTGIL